MILKDQSYNNLEETENTVAQKEFVGGGLTHFTFDEYQLNYVKENGLLIQGYNARVVAIGLTTDRFYVGGYLPNSRSIKKDLLNMSSKYDTLTVTLKNTAKESRDGWGNLTLNTVGTADSEYDWTKMDADYWDADLYSIDKYGQFKISPFDAGATATISFDLADFLSNCDKASDVWNAVAFQLTNDAIIESIYLSNK